MRIAALLLALVVLVGCSSPSRLPGGEVADESAAVSQPAGPIGEQTPEPPAGVADADGPDSPGGAAGAAPGRDWDERARRADERLAELRQELSYPIFVPTQVLEGLHPLMPTHQDRLVRIVYVDDDLQAELSVASGPAGCCIDADPRKMVGGGTPIRDGREARFIPNQPEFGGNIVWWNEDGAYIALSGPHLTQEDLFAIAESMSPTALLSGPGGEDEAASTPPDVYPPDFRTQIAEVDAVIDAFLAKDVDRLVSCDMLECEEDAEGALAPRVTWGSCQVNNTWTGRDTVRSLAENWVGGSRWLYAAYRVHGIGDWAYFVQFAEYRHDHGAKAAVLNEDGRILQLWMGCGAPLDMPADHYEPIAPPRVGR